LSLSACFSAAPDLKMIEPAEWRAALEDHRGAPVAVNVWANWCRSCLGFLPSFVALPGREEYGDIQFMSVVVEDPADAPALAEAKRLVVELDARFPHFAIQTGVEETLGLLGVSDLPAVLIFDAEGRLRHLVEADGFDGEMHLEDVEDALDSVLAK
jgi:thiol-disulfide isomerase/thioredoxin